MKTSDLKAEVFVLKKSLDEIVFIMMHEKLDSKNKIRIMNTIDKVKELQKLVDKTVAEIGEDI